MAVRGTIPEHMPAGGDGGRSISVKDAAPVLSSDELRDLLRVVRSALLMLDRWWESYPREQYPKAHPCRQAVSMVVRYIERRYGV